MSSVRQRQTGGEVKVARALKRLGLALRRNVRSLPGSPDLVTHEGRVAVFVNGCFWHRHRGCSRTTTPQRNRRFWVSKFRANVARDRRNTRLLLAAGIEVIVIWECETKDEKELILGLARAFRRLRLPATFNRLGRK